MRWNGEVEGERTTSSKVAEAQASPQSTTEAAYSYPGHSLFQPCALPDLIRDFRIHDCIHISVFPTFVRFFFQPTLLSPMRLMAFLRKATIGPAVRPPHTNSRHLALSSSSVLAASQEKLFKYFDPYSQARPPSDLFCGIRTKSTWIENSHFNLGNLSKTTQRIFSVKGVPPPPLNGKNPLSSF